MCVWGTNVWGAMMDATQSVSEGVCVCLCERAFVCECECLALCDGLIIVRVCVAPYDR